MSHKLTEVKRRYYVEQLHGAMYRNGNISLSHVYERYSRTKLDAYGYCKDVEYELNGHHGAIVTYTNFIFTYGFYYDTIDGETGELHRYFCYITPNHDYTWRVN